MFWDFTDDRSSLTYCFRSVSGRSGCRRQGLTTEQDTEEEGKEVVCPVKSISSGQRRNPGN